jgi:hypothetical protein
MVKVIVNFTDYRNVVIPYFAEVNDTPLVALDICWNATKHGTGIVDNIQVNDSNLVYTINVPKGLELFDHCNLSITYPNKIFVDQAKETNIVSIAFCMDTLPSDMNKFVNELIDGIDDAHHAVINSVTKGFYRDMGGK